jgi:hypothetical protein
VLINIAARTIDRLMDHARPFDSGLGTLMSLCLSETSITDRGCLAIAGGRAARSLVELQLSRTNVLPRVTSKSLCIVAFVRLQTNPVHSCGGRPRTLCQGRVDAM